MCIRDRFGADEFAAMKDGVVLVNAARGGIFNMDALADFVAAGKIAAVAVDSFEACLLYTPRCV